MQQQVTNLTQRPLEIEDGTILAAAGTDGSSKLAELSEADEVRLLDGGLVSVREVQLKAVAPAKPDKADGGKQ